MISRDSSSVELEYFEIKLIYHDGNGDDQVTHPRSE